MTTFNEIYEHYNLPTYKGLPWGIEAGMKESAVKGRKPWGGAMRGGKKWRTPFIAIKTNMGLLLITSCHGVQAHLTKDGEIVHRGFALRKRHLESVAQ
ncbi:MAG: hypothetical protein GWN86_23150, partial [Desulfobacterales bacterium]|nr:hypothetical protein [Desulfobacterales bacterium]